MDCEAIKNEIVRQFRKYMEDSGYKKGVIGISGGLDSAVVLKLAIEALGNENVYGLIMPYVNSDLQNTRDSVWLCDKWNIEYGKINITKQIDSYYNEFDIRQIDEKELKLRIGNKCARERMSILYDYSVILNALVIGTSNKSEIEVGYCTLWGDMCAAFDPIGDLYKTEVFELARYLGVPEEIINKPPSADLWQYQTDEGEMGITYEELDRTLIYLDIISKTNYYVTLDYNFGFIPVDGESNFEYNRIKNKLSDYPFFSEVVEMKMKSNFKRKLPPVFDLKIERSV